MNELKAKLESLSVQISRNPDGKYAAFTTQEPLFCFVRDSVQELNWLVVDTLQSYVRSFYDIELSDIEMIEQPQQTMVPIHELIPLKRLTPKLPHNFGDVELVYA